MRVKIYLDANELYGFFRNAIKALKHFDHNDMPENIRKFTKDKNKVWVTSIIAKAEARRKLRAENPLIDEDKFNKTFEKFWLQLVALLDLTVLEEVYIDKEFDKMINGKVIKCHTADLMHIFVAKKLGAKIYSSDRNLKDAIKKLM